MRELFFCLMAVAALILSPATAAALCASKTEAQALNLRALESSLMVAALSCNQQPQYNQFIHKNQSLYSAGGSAVKAYFRRAYGGRFEQELNRFITRLANDASQTSMKQESVAYCEQMKQSFDSIVALDQKALYTLAATPEYSGLHGIRPCGGRADKALLTYNQRAQ